MEGFMILLFVLLFILSAFALKAAPLRDEDNSPFLDDDLVETIHDD
jgi:hypothetical protein